MTAAPAAAAPFVDVTYDLSDSTAIATVVLLNLDTETPPHGTISGTQTLRFASDSAGGLATGPVELLTFNFEVHATVGAYQPVKTPDGGFTETFVTLNTSDLYFEFLSIKYGPVLGTRRAGGTIDPRGAVGLFQVSGYMHCFLLCTPIPGAVQSESRQRLETQRFTQPLPTLTGAVGTPHTLYGSATGVEFGVGVAGATAGDPITVTGRTTLVGREVNRTAVPEPGTLPLLAGGLAGLGLAAAAWRRRKASTRPARALVLVATPCALLALGVGAPPAQAAGTVDVTYDLADTDLVWEFIGGLRQWAVSNDDDVPFGSDVPGIVSGSMKVRYASDSGSGLSIQTGPATLESFRLTAESLSFGIDVTFMTATLRWQLTGSEAGSLTPEGALTGLDAGLLLTGTADCKFDDLGYTDAFSRCFGIVGLPTFTHDPSYSRSGPIELTGGAVPSGGIQSTQHTLSGRGRAVGWQPGAGLLGLGNDFVDRNDRGGVYLAGREILREGEGHPDKVVPEPGTLLLLGAGTAGLALVGHRSRRSWVH